MSLYLGIDTSNYTTSVAVCGDEAVSLRKIIDIKEGMRGIRQSDGVFVHLKTLPDLFEKLNIDHKEIKAVGVSVKPRNASGSYMPVFVAGESFARVIASTLSVPLHRFSHQDGHIMAGILSCGEMSLLEKPFCALHLSGGTTEILDCRFENGAFTEKIIGGTLDISLGQLIDRVGVKLGMKFPCGAELDALSKKADRHITLKTSVKDGYMNLSGMETRLLALADTEKREVVAKTTLDFAARSTLAALSHYNYDDILFVGGVSSNTYLRSYIKQTLKANVYFASPELSSDNAMGIAELCRIKSEVI